MVNAVIQGIAEKLRTVFSVDEYNIYIEQAPQSLKAPCFFILCISSSERHVLDCRYRFNSSYDVSYFPAKDSDREECHTVARQLFDLLEFVPTVDGMVRGTEMNTNITDGVLHFLVDYNLFLKKEKPKEDNMETLRVKEGVKIWTQIKE